MTPFLLLYSLILAASPPELADRPQPGGTHESVDERRIRMADIAADAWHVARIDPPLPGRSRVETAIVLLAMSAHESGFRYDVDSGQCAPHECDNGAAKCLLQIHPANDEERAEITSSRVGCFRVGLRRLRGSIRTCTEPGTALAIYAGGSCDSEAAIAESRAHLATIRAWLRRAQTMGDN